MKTDVENLSSTRVKIVVDIPFDELSEDLRDAYRSIGSQVNVPGFRKGKVPPRIIDQRFGRGTVLSEVANAVIPRTYEKVVADESLVPLGQPKVEVTKLEDGDLMQFVAEVDIRPAFDLPDRAAVAVEVDPITIDDDAVDEELRNLRKRFATYTDVDRGAAAGDIVLVDVTAADAEGDPVDAYSAEALSYEVGSGGAIEGFDEAVTGAQADEERTFEFIPAEGEAAGKALTIKAHVTAVRETELPEADDEFAGMASEFDTIEELLEDLRQQLRRSRLMEQGAQARDKVREAFLGMIEMDLPEQFIQDQLEEHFSDGHGDEQHRIDTEQEMRENLKAQLVLDKLAEEDEIGVEEGELTQWLISQASRYGMAPDQFANALVEGGQVQSAIAEVRRAKALSVIVDAATITDSDGNAVDLDEITRLLTGGQASPEIDVEEIDAEDADVEGAEQQPDGEAASAEATDPEATDPEATDPEATRA